MILHAHSPQPLTVASACSLVQHGDLEQLAMVERVSGTIPQFMINQAPADVKEMFDDRGRVKSELVAPDRQSRVNRLMLLPVRPITPQRPYALLRLTHQPAACRPLVEYVSRRARQEPAQTAPLSPDHQPPRAHPRKAGSYEPFLSGGEAVCFCLGLHFLISFFKSYGE